ncbi:MAG: DUF370 domain-containing protein [Clostridiales bacterium]|nr:DUF370 domain-containing protein [Clostridiales bacterium]
MNRFINIGFGNIVASNRIVAVVNPEASPVKRLIREAKKTGKLIDATCGRKTRAAIITDSEHIILAANQPETIAARLSGQNNTKEVSEDV